MMRPMKLGGEQILFGEGSLAHLETLNFEKAVVVIGSDTFIKNGLLDKVETHLEKASIAMETFVGVEPNPGFETVKKGAAFMQEHQPDLIVALGGGSVMDAAKAMWIYYENPGLDSLKPLMDKKTFPKLRKKAKFLCIPTTAGTGSEVSRSIVITDDKTGIKYGIGNMEMMPDIAICDPVATLTLPKGLTAETGMDTIAHALEALASTRANYLSDIMAEKAFVDAYETLPKVLENPKNIRRRETMLNASMVAGMAFTNVSLGIVHSIAHSLGSLFNLSHGLSNAVLLPYVLRFNSRDEKTAALYDRLAGEVGHPSLPEALTRLNEQAGIPKALKDLVPDEQAFMDKLDRLIELSVNDGCTKTNPITPTYEEFKTLIMHAYHGQ